MTDLFNVFCRDGASAGGKKKEEVSALSCFDAVF